MSIKKCDDNKWRSNLRQSLTKKKKKLVKLVEVAIFEMGWKWVFSKSVGGISKGHFFKKFYIK